jgi:deoxyribodipyrimidine photo-lyase
MNQKRIRTLQSDKKRVGPIVYWMCRDQRVNDNWALLFSQESALKQKVPLTVVFCLVPQFLGTTIRQYDFMLKGLQELEKNLTEKNIPFYMLTGSPEEELPNFVSEYKREYFFLSSFSLILANL